MYLNLNLSEISSDVDRGDIFLAGNHWSGAFHNEAHMSFVSILDILALMS